MSSADSIRLQNGDVHPTGFYMVELVIPSMLLEAHGCALAFANPRGIRSPMDPSSNSSTDFPSVADYEAGNEWLHSNKQLSHPHTFAELARLPSEALLAKFDAVFIPGGHAPLIDLWNDPDLGAILQIFAAHKRLTGALCHGPVAFGSASVAKNVSIGDGDGAAPFPYKGVAMTVFSTPGDKYNEQQWGGKLPASPGYPAEFLANLGVAMAEGPMFQSHVVVDDTANIVTGQNPASAPAFAAALLRRLLDQ